MRRFLLLGAALLCGLPAGCVQPPPAPSAAVAPGNAGSEGRALAARALDRLDMDRTMLDFMTNDRPSAVATLKANGLTDRQAGIVFDRYMLPEMRRRFPELRAQMVDIMADTLTVPELHALADGVQNEARQGVAAKAGLLKARWHEAGTAWGARLGQDVTDNNAAALRRLGVGN